MRTFAVAMLASSLVFAPALARAESHGEAHDPDNVTAISEYMVTVVKGVERLNAKEYTNAIDTLRRAVRLAPKHPLAHVLLAEIFLQRNNLGEAEASLAQGRDADRTKDPASFAHALYLSGDLFEREKKWEDARAAWQAYVDFASKGVGGALEIGKTRLAAATKRAEMEKAYAVVRARIAADKK